MLDKPEKKEKPEGKLDLILTPEVEKEQEDTAIQEAEGVTDALVEDTIVTARREIKTEKNIRNKS